MFGAVKLTKNGNPNKYSFSGYRNEFDSHSIFLIPNFDWGKNVVIFGADMGSSVHTNNKNKNILILGKGETKGLDNISLTAEESRSKIRNFKIRKKILFESSL